MTTWQRTAEAVRFNRARTTSATGGFAALVLAGGLLAAVGPLRVALAIGPAALIYVLGPGLAERLARRMAPWPVRPAAVIVRHALTTHAVRTIGVLYMFSGLIAPGGVASLPAIAAAFAAGLVAYELPRQVLPLLVGRRPPRQRAVHAILIDQASTLGDLVLSTACLQAIAESSPGMRVSYLCRAAYTGLLDAHPAVASVFAEPAGAYAADRQAWGLAGIRRLRAIIEQSGVDAVAALWNRPTPYMPVAAVLGRVPTRCGFLDREGYGWMFNAGRPRPASLGAHQAERYLECLRSVGIDATAIPRLSVRLDPREVEHARLTLVAAGVPPGAVLIALSPGTGGSNRPLLPETYASFLHRIRTRFGAHAIVLGSGDERSLVERVAADSPPGTAVQIGGTIGRHAAFISLARVHVGSDSGPGHLAAALGVSSVVAWPAKASKALRWGPWMTPHVIVRRRAWCPLVCVPWTCESDACVRVIGVDDLVDALETVLEGGGPVQPRDGRRNWMAASVGVVVHAPDAHANAAAAFDTLAALRDAQFVDVSLACPPSSALAARAAAAGFDVRGCDARSLVDLVVEFDGGVVYDLAARATRALGIARVATRGWTRNPVYRVAARDAAADPDALADYLLEAVGGRSRLDSAANAAAAERW